MLTFVMSYGTKLWNDMSYDKYQRYCWNVYNYHKYSILQKAILSEDFFANMNVLRCSSSQLDTQVGKIAIIQTSLKILFKLWPRKLIYSSLVSNRVYPSWSESTYQTNDDISSKRWHIIKMMISILYVAQESSQTQNMMHT